VGALLQIGTNTSLGEDVDFPLKKRLEILARLDEIKEAATALHFDKEVYIAFRACLSRRHGPRYPHVVCSVFVR